MITHWWLDIKIGPGDIDYTDLCRSANIVLKGINYPSMGNLFSSR